MNDNHDEKEMSFLDHLEELRWHIIRILVILILLSIIAFINKDWIFYEVIFGPTRNDFFTYKAMCEISQVVFSTGDFCFAPPEFRKIATGFAETFFSTIKMCFFFSFVVGIPYILFELWEFIKPGLYVEEKKAAKHFVLITSSLFFIGILFGYYIVAPFGVSFLGGFSVEGVENMPTLGSFLTYMTMFTIPTGVIFLFPLVVYLIAKAGGIISPIMKGYKKPKYMTKDTN